jgi:uncharacterized protein YecE (DUF72 family)
MFSFYARLFDTVEINNTFYRLPAPDYLRSWSDTAPLDFCFAIKASRYLTHMKKLKDPKAGLARFLPLADLLGTKLGPMLFQLPPHWDPDLERLAAFLAALPASHRYAFELRDPSWHTAATYRLLARHNASLCIYELAGFQSPVELTADFVYVRLHGPAGKYQGSYDHKSLAAWAERLRTWQREGRASYVYFDNDEAGFAPRNARELCRLLAH